MDFKIEKHAFRMLMEGQVTFNQILQEHEIIGHMERFLLDDYMNAGGSPSVQSSEIVYDETTFDLRSLTGSIFVKYTIHYYFSCEGMTNSDRYENTFKVSFNKETLSFTIHKSIKWQLDN